MVSFLSKRGIEFWSLMWCAGEAKVGAAWRPAKDFTKKVLVIFSRSRKPQKMSKSGPKVRLKSGW